MVIRREFGYEPLSYLNSEDSNLSRWSKHLNRCTVQRAFTDACETPEQFGKIVRKRKEQRNIDKAVEAMFGYATSMSAWFGGDLAEPGVDISVFLHELASQCERYIERTKKDFADEVHRKRVKIGL